MFTIALLFLAFWQQHITIPNFRIEVGPMQRTSKYEYKIADDDGKSYLEMRQVGKEKWARVEELKCGKPNEIIESHSFDYSFTCLNK